MPVATYSQAAARRHSGRHFVRSSAAAAGRAESKAAIKQPSSIERTGHGNFRGLSLTPFQAWASSRRLASRILE